jgi:hypothetical protein
VNTRLKNSNYGGVAINTVGSSAQEMSLPDYRNLVMLVKPLRMPWRKHLYLA